MSAHVIANPVPTPEEMGKILGLSSERVASVRRIMSAPIREGATVRANRPGKFTARKKAVKKAAKK